MKVKTKTIKKFKYETSIFEELLVEGESLCLDYRYLVTIYSIENAHGTINFLMTRNLRLTKTSFELALEGKYTEATCVIRAALEGALLARLFAEEPSQIKEWAKKMRQYNAEANEDKKKKLWNEYWKVFGPHAIRKKIAGDREKLLNDITKLYSSLSTFIHPPLPTVGEFIIDQKISMKQTFHEKHFIDWYKAACLTLATSLRPFETLYRKKINKTSWQSLSFETEKN